MPAPAVINEVGESIIIKVSAKNQLTIPSAARKKYGFGEYALCTFTEEGILIQPVEPSETEDLTVELLRYLVQKGYEGEELIAKLEEIKPKFHDYYRMVRQAEHDVAEGKVGLYEALDAKLKDKYDL